MYNKQTEKLPQNIYHTMKINPESGVLLFLSYIYIAINDLIFSIQILIGVGFTTELW